MSNETFLSYWAGEEPAPPCPTLGLMPAQVDVVPLAFVLIDEQYRLDFTTLLCKTHPASVIQAWVDEVRSRGTKVVLSINSDRLATVPDVPAFVAQVVAAVRAWRVDGIDLDCEPPPDDITKLLAVARGLRTALGPGALLTAPIYSMWSDTNLKAFAATVDYVTTMDYSTYPGLDGTKRLVNGYVKVIGDSRKVAIGVSCMLPPDYFTPIEDVVALCRWEPDAGPKRGVMLYTFSYDIKARPGGGTGLPAYAFTKTIVANLP
jgi:hypothetical protein